MSDNRSTVRAIDGRTLAYVETGNGDGVPVFYFHGLPGSGADVDRVLGEEALAGSGVRVIGLDRPGFGASDFQPRRRYDDWPADVAAVADALGLGRFGVLGYSSGGPYVIACAQAFPERLTFAGIVGGVGPAETPGFRRGMGKTDALMSRLSQFAPPLARLAIKQARGTAQRSPEKFSRQFDKDLSPPDLETHRDPAFRQAVREIFLDATRSGPAGVVHEYRITGARWGIALEQIDFPIQLWQGEADAIVPMHHAEYVAERLANATLTVMPGVGHLHTAKRWHDFFVAAGAADSARSRSN
jgi:pimeloyl-ACP methyl ester carboxylesterase